MLNCWCITWPVDFKRLKDKAFLKNLCSLRQVKGDTVRKCILFPHTFMLCYKQVFSLYDAGVQGSDFAPKECRSYSAEYERSGLLKNEASLSHHHEEPRLPANWTSCILSFRTADTENIVFKKNWGLASICMSGLFVCTYICAYL